MTNIAQRVRKFLRQVNRLPGRLTQIERALARLEVDFAEHKRETRLILDAMALPPVDQWKGQPPLVPNAAPGERVFPGGVLCRQDSFRAPYFSYWTGRLGESLRYHRKLWEFVFIAQALWERGAVRPGSRALGFGVGLEPLPAFFASQEVAVVATDLAVDDAVEMGWVETLQHAHGKESLRRPFVCPDALFDRNVSFRQCDMNAVPADLADFDFCWSACALEHLGSIEKGLAFIERSVECLKPGGWAVHTTEFNLSSDTATVDQMETVLFRRSDLDTLARRLAAKGHRMAIVDWNPGDEPLDVYYDVPPYKPQPHVKVAFAGFATTSIGLIVQRGDQ